MREHGAVPGDPDRARRAQGLVRQALARRQAARPTGQGGWQTLGPSAIAFGDYPAAARDDASRRSPHRGGFPPPRRCTRSTRASTWSEIHGAHGYLLHSVRLAAFEPARRRIRRIARQSHALAAGGRARGARGVAAATSPSSTASRRATGLEGGWDIEQIGRARAAPEGRRASTSSTARAAATSPTRRSRSGPGYQVPFAEAIRRAGRDPGGRRRPHHATPCRPSRSSPSGRPTPCASRARCCAIRTGRATPRAS